MIENPCVGGSIPPLGTIHVLVLVLPSDLFRYSGLIALIGDRPHLFVSSL